MHINSIPTCSVYILFLITTLSKSSTKQNKEGRKKWIEHLKGPTSEVVIEHEKIKISSSFLKLGIFYSLQMTVSGNTQRSYFLVLFEPPLLGLSVPCFLLEVTLLATVSGVDWVGTWFPWTIAGNPAAGILHHELDQYL